MKKLFYLFILIIILLANCGEDEYDVDFDDEKLLFEYHDGKIIFENNTKYPIVLDHMRINDREVTNFIKYNVCEYIKYKDEVVVNYNDDLNQIIYLTSIIIPGNKVIIEYTLKKDDYVELELYPVNYNFLSDNVYFINENISDHEKRYKLYSNTDIEELNISYFEEKENINKIDGIMIFVSEYAALADFLEEVEFITR